MKNHTRKILLLSAVMSLALMGGALAACGESHTEHVFGDWVEVTAAGCEENGLKKRVCTISGCDAEETEEIPALGHSWGASKVTKTATCTQEGERTKTCSRCGQSEKETTPTIEHDWVTTSTTVEPTCTETGKGVQTCSYCGATQNATLPELGHDWDVPEVIVVADCENAGKERKTCKRCGTDETEDIPPLEHQWKNTRVIEPATCTEKGKQEQTCQRPNCPTKTQEVDIPALDHSWQSYYTVDKQPSFEEAGSKSYHCNRCGAHNGETEIPKLDHNTPIAYEFRTLRNNGQILIAPTMTLIVKDEGGTEVARAAAGDFVAGVFTKELFPENYTVTVENPPEGYSCSTSFTVTPYDPYCNIYLTASLREGAPVGSYKAGDVMYDFTVPAASSTGGALKLSDVLKTKKMVLLNFWYVDCIYCEDEFPALQRAYTEYQDKVEVIAVNQNDAMSAIVDYKNSMGLTFPLVQNNAIKETGLIGPFGVTSYPTTVVIDREGVVCEILVGPQTQAEFERLFAKYTAEDYLKAPAQAASAQAPVQVAILPDKRGEI